MTETSVKYIAEISPVREVTLRGAADLRYWRGNLAAEGLIPAAHDGHAEVVVSAMSSQFKGIAFREFCVGVMAKPRGDESLPTGMYLAQAFNSSRLLGWLERTFFSTPYQFGEIIVDSTRPAQLSLSDAGHPVFHAELGGERPILHSGDDGFTGTIYLPSNPRRRIKPGRWFAAKIAGATAVYAHLPDDPLVLNTSDRWPVFEWLRSSQFSPREWHIRESAIHARSKTFRS